MVKSQTGQFENSLSENKRKDLPDRCRDYYVVKSNDLIQRTRYAMPLSMQKAFAYICSLIRPPDNNNPYAVISLQLTYSFELKEYCRICGIKWNSGGSALAYVKHSLKALADESIFIETDDGKEELCRWLDTVVIDKNSGLVTVTIGKQLAPYLMNLKEQFTRYELWNILNMKSAYSIRLYELLKSYLYLGRVSFSVDDLRKYLFVRGKSCERCRNNNTVKCTTCEEYKNVYSHFRDFNKKVLRYSVDEINLYSNICVRKSTITKGHRVERILFELEPLDSFFNSISRTFANELVDHKRKEF